MSIARADAICAATSVKVYVPRAEFLQPGHEQGLPGRKPRSEVVQRVLTVAPGAAFGSGKVYSPEV